MAAKKAEKREGKMRMFQDKAGRMLMPTPEIEAQYALYKAELKERQRKEDEGLPTSRASDIIVEYKEVWVDAPKVTTQHATDLARAARSRNPRLVDVMAKHQEVIDSNPNTLTPEKVQEMIADAVAAAIGTSAATKAAESSDKPATKSSDSKNKTASK